MKCPGCGNQLGDNARFCGVCGASTSGPGTQFTAAPAAPPVRGPVDDRAMIGREIAGRYRLVAKLGEGGMGAVYRAEQISLKRQVAVKLLRPEVLGNELLLRRFNAEAEAVAKLSHPNTVNIYDFGQDGDGSLFIAMEYIDGQSLRSVLHREQLSPRRALAIAHQVAASLSDAHAHNLIHRDLKPDNVMLQDRGREHDVARVLDFGIAKLRDENRATQMQMTQQGDMVGTPQYMAPEQIRGEKVDGRTDVYALGCMLYEMFTGRMPYEAPTVLAMLSKHLIEAPVPPSQRRPDLGLPPQVDALILGAMAKDPAQRPATMDQLGEQLAELLAIAPPDPRAHRPSASASGVQAQNAPTAPGAASHVGPASHGGAIAGPVATPAAPSAYARPNTPTPAPYAPPGYAPPGYAPPGYAPVVPTPAQPPRARSKAPAIALAALVVLGGGGAAVYVATRPAPAPQPAPAPTPTPPAVDPWKTDHAIPGNKASIGQGVSLIIPPEFGQTGTQGNFIYALDGTGLVITAGPIEFPSNNLDELAANHARTNKLVREARTVQITVGGVQRPLYYFDGVANKTAFRQVVLPLIGPGYRIAVIFQAPTARLESEQKLQLEMLNLFTQRIILP